MAELSEVVAEEIADQAVAVEKVVHSLNQIKLAYAGIGAACGAAVGALIAFNIAYKRANKKYSEISQNEIDEMREHYVKKTEATMGRITKPDLDVMVDKLGYHTTTDTIKKDSAPSVVTESPAPVVETALDPVKSFKNVFEVSKEISEEDALDVWDYAVEVRSRAADVPYVIHVDEHTENVNEYEQTTLTYYEDDDVLADQRDNVVDDQDELVGVQNLGKFGHGSNDPNIVYVRNDRITMDFEICRSAGSYAKEVHGFEHSDVPRRSRPEWDG